MYLRRAKGLLMVLMLLAYFKVTAQQQKYAHQLALIDSVKRFLVRDLRLDPDTAFYTRWDTRPDSMFIYLYVSKNNCIQPPEGYPSPLWVFDREDSANARSIQLQALGYETMVYRTAGTSDAYLTPKLLSYPDEAIAFIVIHEAAHRRKWHGPEYAIPYYSCEEALADAVANAACVRFATETKMLDMKRVLNQKRTFEKIYALLNRSLAEISASDSTIQAAILKHCSPKIWKLAGKGNQFVKDRMQYPVNHAYFLRVSAYALQYFRIQKMLGAYIDIPAALKTLHRLFAYQLTPVEKEPDDNKPAEIILPKQPSYFELVR